MSDSLNSTAISVFQQFNPLDKKLIYMYDLDKAITAYY